MEMADIIIIWYLLTLFVGVAIYRYLNKPFSHWNIRGVYHLKPLLVFGNIKDRILFRKPFHIFQRELYNQFKGHRYAGFYEGRKPVLMVLDPDLLKNILVRDFNYFVDRPVLRFNTSPYTEKMILSLKGQDWKSVRTVMTPAFSSGKLKLMELLIRVCAKQIEDYLDKTIIETDNSKSSEGIEMKDFFGRFTMDVIASCAFGVQSNSLQEPNAEFYKEISKFTEISLMRRFALFFVLLFVPQYSRFFPLSFFNEKTIDFLGKVVINAKHHRLKNPESRRNDFLQLMLDAEVNESEHQTTPPKINGENDSSEKSSGDHNVITEDVVVAQSVLFLIAGFETSSTLLTFASYELALNPEIQDKLREEILTVLDKHNGECNYMALSEMNYLEMVLNETLRKHPPISRTDRVCTKKYEIPDSNLVINPGESVCIPIVGIHYDPDYYPNPEKFDPERFSVENKNERSPYVFLPFGAGPRNCIGLRFAMMSSKSAMVHLLKKYKFTVCEKTEIPYTYSKFTMLLSAKNGVSCSTIDNIEALKKAWPELGNTDDSPHSEGRKYIESMKQRIEQLLRDVVLNSISHDQIKTETCGIISELIGMLRIGQAVSGREDNHAADIESVLNVGTAISNYVCGNDGEKLSLFLEKGGRECTLEQCIPIETCLEKLKHKTVQLHSTEKAERVCRLVDEAKHCVFDGLSKCHDQTPAELSKGLFDTILAEKPCKKYGLNSSVLSHSLNPWIIFCTLPVIVLNVFQRYT